MDSASYRYSRVWFENVIFPTSTLPVFKKRASYASCSLSLISTWFLFLCKVSPVRNVSSASIRNPHCRTSGLVSISNSFEVSAWKDAERGLAAGFSVHVLATDSLTVVFGDTFDSILDFINDKRIDVVFTEARIVFADGESETRSITGNTPYVFAFDGVRAVKDVEFISGDLTIKYSDFFSEDLMEASETLDTADLFN